MTDALVDTGNCLLRNVLDRHDDDGVRLIYADWLDEHGQPERAEFIRVQVKLARLGEKSGHPKITPLAWSCKCAVCVEAKPLREQEQELFGGWFDWTLPPPSPGGTRQIRMELQRSGGHTEEYVVRRGFVAHVELTTTAFLGGPCGRCSGTGLVGAADGSYLIGCPGCSGSGRTPGIAAGLFAAQPVVSVRLTDKRPAHQEVEGYWFWLRGRPDTPATRLANEPYWIPAPLWQRLGKYEQPTEQAANADLSAACVRYGRELAGLSKT